MNNEQQETIATETELVINMTIAAWYSLNKRMSELLAKLSDDDLAAETAPGRNSGIYLLGHLATVNDGMLALMGLQQRLRPELEDTFIKSPDRSGKLMPAATELRMYWQQVNDTLAGHFRKMSTEEWFGRHMSVSEEDFKKEPHRNKLNILISRTGHQHYHMGQLAYLVKK